MGFFVQDDWKTSKNLTLNLGLRWEMDFPRSETKDHQSGFDPLKRNPVSRTPGVITFAGTDGVGSYAHQFDTNNYGPRAGFAYRLTVKTVLRGGYGLMYNGQYSIAVPFILFNGFGTSAQVDSPDGGFTAAFRMKDGMPAVPREALSAGFGTVPLSQNPRTATGFFQQNHVTGYVHQVNFVVQRAITSNISIEAAYQGAFGHKLSGQNYEYNEIPLVNGAGPAAQNRLARRFLQFSSVTHYSPPWGNSSYNSLNIKIEKRYSSGLNFLSNYTWSKFIDDIQDAGPLGGATAGYQHSELRKLDRALSGMDVRNRLMLSTVYDLPGRRGGRYQIQNKFLNNILGDWGISIIGEFRGGVPVGISELVNSSNTFSSGQRSNVSGASALTGGSRNDYLAKYFDTSVFTAPAAVTFGNAPRSQIVSPGLIGLDGSVHKSWKIHESLNLKFRTDFYNFPNRPNFNIPGTVRGSADFGRITSTLGGTTGRLIQFSLRLEF